AYAYKEGSWNEFRSIPPLNLATSLGIRIVLCNEVIPMSLPDFPGPSGQKKFLVYPNPSAGDFVIKHTNPSGSELKIQVFDLTGRMVLNDEQSGSRESFKIRMTSSVPGMYIIRIIEGKAVYTAKITITK
ncbi:MAG: T9SS type A sorting domain-containing protein, partial [Bacteroidales bacterium]